MPTKTPVKVSVVSVGDRVRFRTKSGSFLNVKVIEIKPLSVVGEYTYDLSDDMKGRYEWDREEVYVAL